MENLEQVKVEDGRQADSPAVEPAIERVEETVGPGASTPRRFARIAGCLLLVTGTIIILRAIFSSESENRRPDLAGQYRFDVGTPGPGDPALPLRLPSTNGGEFNLDGLLGSTVLLYFQEGVMCQPCWDQLKEIEMKWSQFEALGIDSIVSVTSDPLEDSRRKIADEGLTTAVLADPDPMSQPEDSVQEAYQTNRYGMMGKMHSGHTFIVVGPDGKILWRADYGGPPDFTMYLPVSNLLADMKKGLEKGVTSQ